MIEFYVIIISTAIDIIIIAIIITTTTTVIIIIIHVTQHGNSLIIFVGSRRRFTLAVAVSVDEVRGGDGADVEEVDGEEEEGAEEIDPPGDEYREERKQREKEERRVSNEACLVKRDGISVRAHRDAYDSDDGTGDKEGAAEDAV